MVENPKMPNFKPPSPPKVRPEVEEAIDRIVPSLSLNEKQYFLKRVKETIIGETKRKEGEAEQATQPEDHELVDPSIQPILDDLKMCEEYMTQGFTVKYPPKALMPIQNENEPSLETILKYAVDRLTENPKVSEGIGRILCAIADKMEGKT